jgi:hypothetical protein
MVHARDILRAVGAFAVNIRNYRISDPGRLNPRAMESANEGEWTQMKQT